MKKSAEGKRDIMTKATTRARTSTKKPAKEKEKAKTEASGCCWRFHAQARHGEAETFFMSALVALDALNPPGSRSHECSIGNLPGQKKYCPGMLQGVEEQASGRQPRRAAFWKAEHIQGYVSIYKSLTTPDHGLRRSFSKPC
jgi:hypothetical protein